MMLTLRLSSFFLVVACVQGVPVSIVEYREQAEDLVLAEGTMQGWQEMNDPVMGGQSVGSFFSSNGTGTFHGTVKNVTFLNAPGFCQVSTKSPIVDASAYLGIKLEVRSSTPEYRGFKLAFNAVGAPRHHGGHEVTGSYKTSFALRNTTDEYQIVTLPFSQFSSDWSDYTGDCSTKDPDGYQHVCCSPFNPEVCPDAKRLAQITGFSLWAEGAEGDFLLQFTQINATVSI